MREVAAGQASGLFLVDALRELDALLREGAVRVHAADCARELAHLQEELDGEELELRAGELPVGDGEPQRVAAEGSARLDARHEILDESFGCQYVGHRDS